MRLLGSNMEDVRALTERKKKILMEKDYRVVEMWECEWEAKKREDVDVKAFVDRLDLQDPLDPRDAFFGGRTNAIQLYALADVSKGEEIHYYDYT